MHQSYSVSRGKKELNSTWHAHFYSKPPETPTPHFIEDILGLRSQATRQDGKEMREKFAVHKQNDQEISGTLLEDMHCTRKSKQSSKYKPRRTVGNHKDALGSRPKAVSSPKRRRDEQTIVTKVKESQQSKHITQAEIKKKKKARTTFTGRQIWELENTFKEKKYLTSAERNDLAELLNVTDCQVKIWFQNRRTKHKKLEVATTNTEPSPNKKDQQSSGGLDCSPTSEEILSSDEKTNNFSKHDSDDDMADVCEGSD